MTLIMTKRSGFALRLMSLGAFSCMMIFAAIVVLQNAELEKVVPSSPARTMMLLFGYTLSIITFNYAMAIKGRNFMGWKIEAVTMIGAALVFSGIFLAHGFPVVKEVKSESWIPFISSQISEPNWAWVWLSAAGLPFLAIALKMLRSLPLWAVDQTT